MPSPSEEAEDKLRRSERVKKGVLPIRYRDMSQSNSGAGVEASAQPLPSGNQPPSGSQLLVGNKPPPTGNKSESSPKVALSSGPVQGPVAGPSSASQAMSGQGVDRVNNEMEILTRNYDRKLNDMKNEFNRQMHAMQNLLMASNKKVQESVTELRSEIRRQPLQSSQQQPPLPQVSQPTSTTQASSSQQSLTSTQASCSQENFSTQASCIQQILTSTQASCSQENFTSTQTSCSQGNFSSTQTSYSQPYFWSTQNSCIMSSAAQPSYETNSTTDSQQTFAHRQKKIYNLPIFSGVPEEWQTFAEAFVSTTSEFEYSPLHNIMRLRDAVKGRAREAVEPLLASSRNVDVIMNILRETFGRPEQLIRSQIEKVRAIPPIVEGSLESLVNFCNKITNMAMFLKNAGGEHHLANPTLISELVAKLPTSKQMQWAEKCIQLVQSPTIMDFSQWLESQRRLANIVTDSLPTVAARNLPRKPQHNTFSNTGRNYACVSVAQRKCLICNGDCDSLINCNSFLQFSADDRYKKVKELKTCFSCLKLGHQLNKCYKKKMCGVQGCRRTHHQLIHTLPTMQPDEREVRAATHNENNRGQGNMASTSRITEGQNRSCYADSGAKSNEAILFQILPVIIHGKNVSVKAYAFVDDGANVTMFDRSLAEQLGIRGPSENLKLQWLNDHCVQQRVEKVEFTISGVGNNATKYKISNVYSTPSLMLPTQSFKRGELFSKFDSLAELPINEYESVQPKLVISLVHAFLTVPLETPRASTETGLIAAKTRLGWVAYGPQIGVSSTTNNFSLHCTRKRVDEDSSNVMEEIHDMMKNYFDAETFGVKADVKKILSKSNEKAVSILKNTTKYIGDRYESGLLWKENFSGFPNSYQMALNRLETLERKMSRDLEFAEQYRSKISQYLKKGFARKLSTEEARIRTNTTFYLPHFGVKNPNKNGIRLVFDAAAEVQGISLNKALYSGPDINQPLMSILFLFRQAPIAVCGDIEEMFHQVVINKTDQDSQRFLWRDGDTSQPIETYVMNRLIFGATCSPTIAQYVKNLNAERFKKEAPRAVKGIIEKHYVDDYVDCFSTEEEAIKVVNDVIRIHAAGGFRIRNFVSNSNILKNSIGNTETNGSEIVKIGVKMERILGMSWIPETDEFVFALTLHKVPEDILKFKRVPTKREVLSLNMSMFDPYGCLADYLVSGKILMQAVWKSGVQWDEPVPAELYRSWCSWIKELHKVEQFKMQRCYFNEFEKSELDLHVFADASEEAMAVVAYWRAVSNGEVVIKFVAGKSSCAPTRYHTIPKLELQAAVMAARLKESLLHCHTVKVRRCYFWSDSHTVIRWIRSDHRNYKQYVANRVSEILEKSDIEDWRWCPGDHNPADEATRAKFPPRYEANGRWTSGPAFLFKKEDEWPDESTINSHKDRSQEECRAKRFILLSRQVCLVVPIINRFSNFCRLRRATAWVLRYKNNLRKKAKQETRTSGELTAEEEMAAEKLLCLWVQQQAFSSEFALLKNNESISASSVLKSLNPVIGEDELLRVNGRIENATFLPFDAKRPIILPKDHQLTRLIVQHYHQKFLHINVSTVMSEIRSRFWIPSLRSLVKSVQANCQICRITRAKPIMPQMGPLPIDRVTPYVRPFSYTGVDFFGPINVTIRRQREKRWVALFTCLTIRAVHLETAADLSSDACILCIRNFINRRGVPVVIRSDNGTNFVGIPKELQGEQNFLDHDAMTAALSPLGIKWKFNTPSNPSDGGAWERLVQSVKKSLFAILKEQAPRLETLQSCLIEAENIVNSRPLTHLPVTPSEPEPLTPNNFLLGCSNSTQTPAPFEPRLMCLRKQWRIVQNLKNAMWHQWIKEYLPELTRRTKWCLPSKPISLGCLVLICDANAPRSQWNRGRVVKLFTGKDGITRSAEVKSTAGTYKRPVSKLAVLDVKETDDSEMVVKPPPGQFTEAGMSKI